METARCPVCGNLGQRVPDETVRSLVIGEAPPTGAYSVCLDPGCDVVYFDRKAVFRQREVRVPVAWKRDAAPKYACYCCRVTENEVIRAVGEGGAKTIADVARITGAMRGCACLTNNPKGVCCHADISALIDRLTTR